MAVIDPQVTLELLQEIHAEFLKRAPFQQTQGPAYKYTEAGVRAEFVLYLQRLSALFGPQFACDPEDHCPDGRCPPCDGGNLAYFQQFLLNLQTRNQADLPKPAS